VVLKTIWLPRAVPWYQAALRTKMAVCQHGEHCPMYRDLANYNFSDQAMDHVTSLRHPLRPCKHWNQCTAFRRLCAGGDRFDDRCHNALYIHCRGERGAWGDAHPLMAPSQTAGLKVMGLENAGDGRSDSWYQSLRQEQETLSRQGSQLVLAELEQHGLGHELTLLQEVVPRLRSKARLQEAHRCNPFHGIPAPEEGSQSAFGREMLLFMKQYSILDVELWSLLIYTGTEAQGAIRKSMRKAEHDDSDAEAWRWTITAMRHAVMKLAERPPQTLYHGLNGVKVDKSSIEDESLTINHIPFFLGSAEKNVGAYWGLVSGSMNKDIATAFASGNGGTVPNPTLVGTVLCFGEWSTQPFVSAHADLRWLSKFPYEEEWLMIPTTSHSNMIVNKYSGLSDDEWFERHGNSTVQFLKVKWSRGFLSDSTFEYSHGSV